jgi:Holliday junction DNA helicase RuvA
MHWPSRSPTSGGDRPRPGSTPPSRSGYVAVIAFVRGTVAAVTLSSAVLEVGGVGLEVMCTPGTLATLRAGHSATLPTSMVVREESLTLFGFLDEDEKTVFELVQTASGVGPKLAQALLAVLAPDDLRRAIAAEDVKALTRVPGIGQKVAQRIILELGDRLGAPVGNRGASHGVTSTASWRDQVHQGLTGLGWPTREAEKAVDAVAGEAGDVPDVGALLRAALQTLSRA